MKSHLKPVFCAALLAALFPFAAAAAENSGKKEGTKCSLDFTLKSWSALYKTGSGDGKITCDNGASSDVRIKTHGGGVTFGKSEILDGHGAFSEVKNIKELYGSYAASEAHAGVVESGTAQAMTKGGVSLALSGTGKGFDLGIAFGRFKITPMPASTAKTEFE